MGFHMIPELFMSNKYWIAYVLTNAHQWISKGSMSHENIEAPSSGFMNRAYQQWGTWTETGEDGLRNAMWWLCWIASPLTSSLTNGRLSNFWRRNTLQEIGQYTMICNQWGEYWNYKSCGKKRMKQSKSKKMKLMKENNIIKNCSGI